MSQGEVLKEWTLEQLSLSTSSILLAVITLLMGALMMTACVVAGAYYIYQLIRCFTSLCIILVHITQFWLKLIVEVPKE